MFWFQQFSTLKFINRKMPLTYCRLSGVLNLCKLFLISWTENHQSGNPKVKKIFIQHICQWGANYSFSLFPATQILRYGLLYNEFLLCYYMNNKEKAKLAGISNSINKASKCFCYSSEGTRMAWKRLFYQLFGVSTVAPKPRAEGSSPSAPAKQKRLKHCV